MAGDGLGGAAWFRKPEILLSVYGAARPLRTGCHDACPDGRPSSRPVDVPPHPRAETRERLLRVSVLKRLAGASGPSCRQPRPPYTDDHSHPALPTGPGSLLPGRGAASGGRFHHGPPFTACSEGEVETVSPGVSSLACLSRFPWD